MKIYMHTNFFQAYPVEEAFAQARKAGYDGVEVWSGHWKKEQAEGEMQKLGVIAEEHNLGMVVPFAGDLINPDMEKVRQSVESVKEAFPVIKKYGVAHVNFYTGVLMPASTEGMKRHELWGKGGSAMATDEDFQRVATSLKEIAGLLDEQDMTISLEIHMNCLHDTARSTIKLLDMVGSPRIQANPDLGNMYGTPHAEKPLEAIKMLAGRFNYFHLKNCRLIDDFYDYNWSLPYGDLDHYQILKAIRDTGYDGILCIEYVGRGDPHIYAPSDRDYVGKILRELERR